MIDGQPFQLRLLQLTPALVVDWTGRPTLVTQTKQVIGQLANQRISHLSNKRIGQLADVRGDKLW